MSESASTSSIGSNSSHSKAPGAQLAHKPVPYPRQTINSTLELTKQLLTIDSDPSLGIIILLSRWKQIVNETLLQMQ